MQFSATLLSALALLFGNLPSCQSFQSTFAPARLPLKESSALRPRTTGLEKNKYYHVATANLPRRLMSSTELHVSPLTALASSPLGAVSVLAGIVCFHEAGHYLAARSFNITVEEFSVGFGPKLLGFQAVGNAFNLRALPLGGYVRFPENYDMVKAEEMQEEARQAFLKRREEEGWTGWQEFLNTLTFGQWDERRRQQGKAEQAQQAVEEAAKRSWWQKAIQPKSTTTITNDPEDFEIDYYDDPNLLQNRPWFERAVVLSGGVVFNMILAFSLYFGEINLGSGIPKPIFDSGVVVSQAPRPDGAAMGLLRQGDIITRINGNPITTTGSSAIAASKQVSELIGNIRHTPDGESLTLSVKRENKDVDVAIQPQRGLDEVPTIGVFLQSNFKEIQKIQSNDVGEAAQLAFGYLTEVVTQTAGSILSLLGMLIMGKGPPPGQSVSGPIGLIKAGTEIVSTKDVTAVLLFASALSVNLGVINALPLPALDGGQLVFVIAEALTGRKVNQRLQEGITGVAIFFLLIVSVSTAFSDVGAIISGR